MKIDGITESIIKRLRQDDGFKNITVTSAYPAGIKPTRLGRVCVAVGIGKISVNPVCIDDEVHGGEVTVFADIFIPLRDDCRRAQKIFARMCACLADFGIASISAERITADSAVEAYVLKTAVTLSDRAEFGGDADE